jgi:hypothetical protein
VLSDCFLVEKAFDNNTKSRGYATSNNSGVEGVEGF